MSFAREKTGKTQQATLPVTYPNNFLQIAVERGVAATAVLARTGLRASHLSDPAGRVSVTEFIDLVDAVITLAGDEGIGLEAGLRQPLTAHGSVGVAMMCSPTAGAALEVLQRYWNLRGRGIGFTVSRHGDTVVCQFQATMPMPPAVSQTIMGAMLGSFHLGLAFALGGDTAGHEIWLEQAEPAWFERLRPRLPPARFGMPVTCYRGPASLLARPLPTASPEALATALAICEREALLLGDQGQIVAAARAALVPGNDGYPTPDRLAALLHMSTRTFRRRLEAQGSSYQQLLEDARHRDALQLLENAALEIRLVAARLGYADPANFTRAFRSWTGKTPSHYRELLRTVPEQDLRIRRGTGPATGS